MPQIPLTKWTTPQLAADVATAIGIFRHERLDEPKEDYDQFYAKFVELFEELIDKMPNVFSDPVDPELLSKLVKGRDRKKTLRYKPSLRSLKTI